MKPPKLLKIDEKERNRLLVMINGSGTKKLKKACEVILEYADESEYVIKNKKAFDIDYIVEITNVSRRTIYYYINKYLKDKNFMYYFNSKPTNISDLEKFKDLIITDFEKNPITSYKKGALRIKEITGIERSVPQVQNFLIKHKFYKNSDGFYSLIEEEKIFKY